MKEVILVKTGELALKGLNRGTFETALIKNIKRRLKEFGAFKIEKAQSTIYLMPQEDGINMKKVVEEIQKVFGIAAINLAVCAEKNMEDIKEKTKEYLAERLNDAETFKIDAKRADKTFPLKSPAIQQEMGGFVLDHFPHLKVDVKKPEVLVMIEIRERMAYIHGGSIKGAGGMPVSTSGKAGLLLSGGIDSPVAGYMMAKRGLTVLNIHFESPPYTSLRAREKVLALSQKMSKYTNHSVTLVVDLKEVQEKIKDTCLDGLFTVIMRRYMMKICNVIAEEQNLEALITGESLAQVASQTMKAIACTDESSDVPVFRPLIGMDKIEIIDIAKKIDTFETSILPFEDCCTVFTPKHPITRPNLERILEEEAKLDEKQLIEDAVKSIKFYEGVEYDS